MGNLMGCAKNQWRCDHKHCHGGAPQRVTHSAKATHAILIAVDLLPMNLDLAGRHKWNVASKGQFMLNLPLVHLPGFTPNMQNQRASIDLGFYANAYVQITASTTRLTCYHLSLQPADSGKRIPVVRADCRCPWCAVDAGSQCALLLHLKVPANVYGPG